jgi:hypothetical protein
MRLLVFSVEQDLLAFLIFFGFLNNALHIALRMAQITQRWDKFALFSKSFTQVIIIPSENAGRYLTLFYLVLHPLELPLKAVRVTLNFFCFYFLTGERNNRNLAPRVI